TYPAPTATDLVDGTVPVTCTPASGTLFHNGSTTVQCTATDAQHNTAHRSFQVTVLSANDQLNALKNAVGGARELRGHAGDGIRKQLSGDLNHVGNPMDPHNKYVALTWLNEFVNDVQANDAPSGPITAADSAAWIAAANAIHALVQSETQGLNDELNALK